MEEQSLEAQGADRIRASRGDIYLDASHPGLADRLGVDHVCAAVDQVEAIPSPYHGGEVLVVVAGEGPAGGRDLIEVELDVDSAGTLARRLQGLVLAAGRRNGGEGR